MGGFGKALVFVSRASIFPRLSQRLRDAIGSKLTSPFPLSFLPPPLPTAGSSTPGGE